MGKKLCEDRKVLEVRMAGMRPQYYCKKCNSFATKEKWCCKPKKIK